MWIFFSILFNGLILWAIAYFLPFDAVTQTGVIAQGEWWKLYLTGGVILGMLNFFVRPVLKILGFPFILITFGLFILVINGIILFLLEKVMKLLSIEGISYEINGVANFIIAVAIFTVFNTIYNAFLKK